MVPLSRLSAFLRPFLFSLAILFTYAGAQAQAISPNLFGQNAWMPDTIGSNVLYGKLHTKWPLVAASGARMVRFGGITADRDLPTRYQYIKMIDSVRARGMEPILQVSYHAGDHSAAQAAQLVQYINGTMGRNVKYWSIGNEPDLEYSYTTAAQVAAYIKPFASAMKAADPNIKILGPETAWYNQTIINGLTTPGGPNDITGTDTAGRYYIDIISFHTYPFNGSQTRAQLIPKLTASPGFDTYLSTLSARVASCNVAHGRTGSDALKTAVTEMNVNYQNSSTDNINGTGVNSFIGGQFVAEMFGLGMKNGVDIMTMWSVVEGNSTALNIGYLDRTTGDKKPVYHHYKMMADHFSGSYVSSASTHTNVKVFSSQSSSLTTVLIMNQDLSNNYSYALRLNNAVITATNPLKINVNANIAQMYYNIIPNQSSVLLQFNSQGAIVKKVTYTIAQALSNLSPTVSLYTASVAPALAQPVNNTPAMNSAICSGNTTTLTAAGGTSTVKWYASATATGVIATGSVFTTPVLSSTGGTVITYYAEAVNTITVSARTPVSVTVHPRPVIAVNSGAVCSGNAFTMNPSGAATYSFSSGSATVIPLTGTSYSVSGTSALGCTSASPAIAQVTVNPRPVVTVNSGSVCAGKVFTMTPSGAVSYTFSSGSATVSPVSGTAYSVTGSSAAGCVSSSPAIAQVAVQALPVVSVNSGSICAGQVFTLTPSGAASYTFSSGSATVSPSASTSYSVTGTSSAGCVSSPASASVVVNTPAIQVNSGAVCEGGSFTLAPSGATGYTFSSGSPVVSPSVTTVYTVTGTGSSGCVSTAQATVSVHPKPVVAVNSGSICAGSSFSIVPAGASAYSVSGGSFNVSPASTSVYTVTGSLNGCVSTATSTVSVQSLPLVSVPGGTICKGGSFTLTPSGAASYTFSSGSAVVSPNTKTSYTVWGATGGCTGAPAVANVTVKSKRACTTGLALEVASTPLQPAGEPTIAVISETISPGETTLPASEPLAGTADTAETTGIADDAAAKALSVYPNPNSGEFYIAVDRESVVTVLGISGAVLRSTSIHAGTTAMNIGDLPAGIYLLRVSSGERTEFARVVKR